MPNRLAEATSPYLLQHADNPVDWWEWSPEAFAAATERDVPVLLSVGYASCHWCHVMAHESFEDPRTAELMNERFVCVKVDREERPDVDRIYMDAVQAMTGHGGWPMTVFLTPTGEPFHAGTYYPKEDRHGHPSFTRVIDAVHEAWVTRRPDVEAQAGALRNAVAVSPPPGEHGPGTDALTRAVVAIDERFEPVHGGFGGAPKFPQAPVLEFLLRSVGRPWGSKAAQMLGRTLDAMADGGIHDQVAGGFARYSVDARWLVPHFEKMLYDNALLARIYARAHQVLGSARYADVARTSVEYMLRDLALPGGGLASGEDADSEGEEGKYYVYSWDEFRSITESDAVAEVLGAGPRGNFDGKTIIHRAADTAAVAARHHIEPDELEAEVDGALGGLARLREGRVRPGLDDKVVCAWNGLAIRALAECSLVLGEPRYLEAALDAGRFAISEMGAGEGRLQRAWRDGRTSGPAFCDDYGSLAVAFFVLYQATADPDWFHAGRRLTDEMVRLFWDEEGGGFYATGTDVHDLIARPKNLLDNPTPSDNAVAAEALQHAAAFTGDVSYLDRMEATMLAAGRLLDRHPQAVGHLLAVLATQLEGPVELAVVGDDPARSELVASLRGGFHPGVFLAVGDGQHDGGVPLLEGKVPVNDAAAYVCRGFVCEAPVFDVSELSAALGLASNSGTPRNG